MQAGSQALSAWEPISLLLCLGYLGFTGGKAWGRGNCQLFKLLPAYFSEQFISQNSIFFLEGGYRFAIVIQC